MPICRVEQWRGIIKMTRFHRPLINPYVRFSLIRLSDNLSSSSIRVYAQAT